MSNQAAGYYPPPESKGGWRSLTEPEQAQATATIDLDRLAPARAWNTKFSVPSSIVIIRSGYLVAEWHENGAGPDSRFNIYSCSKSFTGTAYGILFEDARQNRLPAGNAVDLDSLAYRHIPAGYPLTDPGKEQIKFRHLLSMTSGIPGESIGIFGVHPSPGINEFAAALGRYPLTGRGTAQELWAAELAAEPGSRWDYSDPAFAHLSLAFRAITGQEIDQFMQERVFDPIGIENLTWDRLGMDGDAYGRHTAPHTSVHISARELARFGYLMLRQGTWNGQQLVAPWWLQLATRASQTMNPSYGLTWWTNSEGTLWPDAPRDAFSAMGFNTNLCAVIPSLDLVIVRIGLGPTDPTEFTSAPFISAIEEAIIGK